MATFSCSHCGAKITHSPALVGKRAKCPKCQQPIQVPAAPDPDRSLAATSVHPAVPQMPPPITPSYVPAPQPTVVVVGNQEPRLQSGGWFARAFTTTSGIIVSLLVFGLVAVGLPIVVVCGGCLMFASQVGDSIDEVSKKIEAERAANSPQPIAAAPTAVAPNADETSAMTDAPPKAKEQPTASPPPAEEWHPHDQPLATPDIIVRITEVHIGLVPLKDFSGETTSADPLLWLRLTIENRSETKKVEFSRWNTQSFGNIATLEDELGNSYKRINFGFGTKVAGLEPRDSIYPGKSAEAVLVFELPIDAAKTLRLKMPAAAVGGQGDFKFAIPTAAVQR